MKRALSLLLALVLLVGLVPMQAFAAEVTDPVIEPNEITVPEETAVTEPAEVTDAVTKHEHEYTVEVTSPTCIEQGYITYTCDCGYSYAGDYTDTAAHSYKNGICTVCGSDARDDSGFIHAVPESQGVANAITRAYALTDVEWTPKQDVPGVKKIDGEFTVVPFEAGKTYKGIPYSGTIANDGYVGLNVSLESFLTALENVNSVLYTENLFSTNPKSATYFGTVCSKFAQYVLDVPGSFNTNNVANIPGMETIAMPGKYTVDQIKLGDVVLHTADHTTVCTDILYDSDGNVAFVEISEAVLPLARRMLWSPEEFYDHFSGYRLCRYAYIDSTPAVPEMNLSGSYALMPRYGDKFNYPVSNTAGVVDILKSGYSKAVVLRDGVVIQEKDIAGASSFTFDRTVPGMLEMYLVKADGSRSGSVYAYVVKSSVTITDSSQYGNGKLSVSFDGSSGKPLYVQVGSGQSVFCSVEGKENTAEISFKLSRVSSQKVRIAYQNEFGIYLSSWVGFTADTNPSADPLLSQAQYWDGHNITPSSHIPVVQEGKEGYWTYTMIPVEANTTYYSQGSSRLWYLNEMGEPISTYNAFKDGEVRFQFTTPENCAYVSIAYAPSYVEKGTERLEKVLESEPLELRYDDHVDMSGKAVEILDAGVPTSYQVGYGVEENKVLDTAVVTLDGNTLVATGIGTALVKIDGETYEITVTAAPISLLLLIGQSNMRGSEGNADQSIVCPDGMVYATFGDDRGDAEGIMNVNNATNFAASALTGAYSTVNVNGNTDNLNYYPINSLTEAGKGTFGPDSGFAYEWVKQTGEKVWVVNAAHGGSSMTSWQPGATNFKEAVLLFNACQETLRKEIAAGHFTLSHMGYFWCQGCSDYNWTAEKYVTQYLAMHNGLKSAMAFDHDSDDTTASCIFEFAGIIPVRAGHDYNDGYREDVYTDTTSNRFYESFLDLQMTGPRVAQYWLCNNPELEDIWLVCNAGEDWVWMPDGTNGVSKYFQNHYANGTVDYTTQVAQKTAWYTPTTPKEVHDSIHYNQIGYNEVGRESARNALIMLGEIQAPQVETKVELLGWDGYTNVDKISASLTGNSGTLIVPKVYPVWKSKDISYTLTDGFAWSYYDVLADDEGLTGTLSMGDRTVVIEGHSWSEWETLYEASAAGPGKQERVCSHCDKVDTREVDGVWQIYDLAAHLQELPEDVCCDTNLWTALPHESVHFTSGKKWGNTSTPVTSITIPVNPGDRLYATSWKKAGENGHATSNGIRVTFFDAKGIAKTLGPGQSDREFYANGGYLEAPAGAIAINIAMWYDSEDYEVYILNREHDYKNGTCAGCGDHKGAIITQQPESVEQEIGKKFAITVKAEGEGLTYQWYVKEAGAKAFKVSSNKTASYAYTMQTYMHNRQVYCVITDANGYQVSTETATITRSALPVQITEQPSDVYAEMGETFSVKVKAEGEGLTYQWYYKNKGGKNFAASSIKKSTYSSKMVSYMVGRQVYCVVTDKYGNQATSDVVTIDLPAKTLEIVTQPVDVHAPLGQKFSVAPEVQGEGLTYQWYYKNKGGKSFAASSNKTAAYSYSMTNYMNGRQVYCVITDRFGNQVTTDTVTIHVTK